VECRQVKNTEIAYSDKDENHPDNSSNYGFQAVLDKKTAFGVENPLVGHPLQIYGTRMDFMHIKT
jgi:hypothetical protein